jgi:ABC-2 type transport system permease protein
MPSKISSFNKELFLQALRSVGWISIVYFLGLMIAMPIRIIMTYSNKNVFNPPVPVDNLFQYDFVIQMTLLIVIPVLMAVFLFRFLHVKQAADLMHSLPIKRGKIFHHYALIGIILLIVPVILTSISVLITHTVMDLNVYFETKDILYWLGGTVLFNLVLFFAGIFVAMMTGISAVQAVLTYIFLLFPVGITMLIYYNLRIFLYGFPGDYFLSRDLEKLSPITYAAMLEGRPLQWGYIIFYVILAVVLFGLSWFFYKKRRIESASEAIAFSNLRAVFKYGVTTCMMLFGGVYFSEVQNANHIWIIFGYSLGAIIGYFIAEMVLQKTWRVIGNIKGLFIYASVVIVLLVTVQTLGIYENKLPNINEVESVLFTDSPNVYLDNNESYADYFVPAAMTDKENITKVLKLHKQILADKKINQKLVDGQYETAFFMYKLKNGDKVSRQYRLNKEIYEDYYASIYESEEYKRGMKEIFNVEENQPRRITISTNLPGKSVTISDRNEMKDVIQAIKQDILSEKYDEGLYYEHTGPNIEIFLGNKRTVFLNYKPNYKKLTQWLTEKDLLDKAIVTADDIDYILVSRIDEKYPNEPYDIDISKEVEKDPNKLKVTDKKQIELALETAVVGKTHKYIAIMYYKNSGNYSEVFYYNEEHAPDFIKEHFK